MYYKSINKYTRKNPEYKCKNWSKNAVGKIYLFSFT